MSAHQAEAGEPHAAHPAPGIPDVHDEAGETPAWVPRLGVALGLVLVGLVLLALR
jgi:hypothetical protein